MCIRIIHLNSCIDKGNCMNLFKDLSRCRIWFLNVIPAFTSSSLSTTSIAEVPLIVSLALDSLVYLLFSERNSVNKPALILIHDVTSLYCSRFFSQEEFKIIGKLYS